MNSVVHFEIPADDLERAQAFYREAFGWEVNHMPEMGYALLSTTTTDEKGQPVEPGINGGMMTRSDTVTAPIITIDVEDIDQALKQVEELGGSTVAGRSAVGDMGYAAYFRDTEGNTMGLWQNA